MRSCFTQSSHLYKLDLLGLLRAYPGASEGDACMQNAIFVLHPKVLSWRHIPGLRGRWLRSPSRRRPQGSSSCLVPWGHWTQGPDTCELRSAWAPSFLATWLLLANSCPCAVPLPIICVAIHHRPSLGKAKKVALY